MARIVYKLIILLGVGALSGSTLAAQQPLRKADAEAIRGLMVQQEAAWNRGELEAFMAPYWRSDSLLFIGSRGPTYGWTTTLANYRRSYPDTAAMGTLLFDILRTERVGRKHAFVVGKWTLHRAEDKPSGYFTLLWRKRRGVWRIIADHSS